MIYMCNDCRFIFERLSEISQCPNYEKENIGVAKEEDKLKYLNLRKNLD